MKKEGEKILVTGGRGRTSCLNLSLTDCSSLDYEYEAKHSYCVLYAERLTKLQNNHITTGPVGTTLLYMRLSTEKSRPMWPPSKK